MSGDGRGGQDAGDVGAEPDDGSAEPAVPDRDQTPESEAAEKERATAAAGAALQRARAVAAARGLRPGTRPRSRPTPAVAPAAPRRDGDDREPQMLAAGLDRLVVDRGWQVDLAVGGVMGRWPRIVGPDLAAHCTPLTFGTGVLVVGADSTAWATQVRLLVPTLLRRLAEELGEGVVEQVQVRGPASPSWRKGGRAVHGQGPRDTYG